MPRAPSTTHSRRPSRAPRPTSPGEWGWFVDLWRCWTSRGCRGVCQPAYQLTETQSRMARRPRAAATAVPAACICRNGIGRANIPPKQEDAYSNDIRGRSLSSCCERVGWRNVCARRRRLLGASHRSGVQSAAPSIYAFALAPVVTAGLRPRYHPCRESIRRACPDGGDPFAKKGLSPTRASLV